VPEAGSGPRRDVEHGHRPRGERRPDELGRLLFVAVRREPVVHRDRARVGHDVPRDAAADGHGVQALVIPQPVDFGFSRGVRAQDVQDGARLVDRVAPHPRPGGVRPLPGRGDLGPQRPLAAAFDLRRARLHQDREVAGQEFRAAPAQPQQPVTVSGDFLAVVEHVRDVAGRGGEPGGQLELDRHSGFHVGRAAAVEPGSLRVRGQVIRERHGVEVPGQDHPFRPPEHRAGHDRVSVPVHGQVRARAQHAFDRVRERPFLAADRRDVHQLGRQRRAIGMKIELEIHPASLGHRPGLRWLAQRLRCGSPRHETPVPPHPSVLKPRFHDGWGRAQVGWAAPGRGGMALAASRRAVTMTATEGRRTLAVRATA
jgi:hypothetical protein